MAAIKIVSADQVIEKFIFEKKIHCLSYSARNSDPSTLQTLFRVVLSSIWFREKIMTEVLIYCCFIATQISLFVLAVVACAFAVPAAPQKDRPVAPADDLAAGAEDLKGDSESYI